MNDKRCSFHPYHSRNYKDFKSSIRSNWGQRLKLYFLLYNNIILGHYLQLLYSNPLLQTLPSSSVFPACPVSRYPWGERGKPPQTWVWGSWWASGFRSEIFHTYMEYQGLNQACWWGVEKWPKTWWHFVCFFVCKSFMYLKVYTCFSSYSAYISVGMSKTRKGTHLGRVNGRVSDPKQAELQQGCMLLPGLLRI